METQPSLAGSDTRLAQNRSGYWEIRWTERDETGRARTRTYSCRTKDRRLAEDAHRAFLDAARAVGGLTAGGDGALVLVRDVLSRYIADHVELNRGGSASQKWALRPVLDYMGNWSLDDLSSNSLRDYRRFRERQVAGSTVRRELGALRAAMAWAGRTGVTPSGWSLPHVDLPPPGDARENCLTESEAARVWDAAVQRFRGAGAFPARRIGLFVCIALDTAARSAAIEGLTWDRVDMGRGVIDFREPGRLRSKKRRVPVPMSDRLRVVMQEAWDRRNERGGPGDLFVLGHGGSTRKAFERFVAGLGLPDCTRHDLRRTWATLKARKGVPLWEIAGVLGDTVETVTRHYAHHSPDFLRGAVNA